MLDENFSSSSISLANGNTVDSTVSNSTRLNSSKISKLFKKSKKLIKKDAVGISEKNDSIESLSFNEALLLYTEIKLKMASKFREGISYEDFFEFEKTLDQIDKVLQKEAIRITRSLSGELDENAKSRLGEILETKRECEKDLEKKYEAISSSSRSEQ